MGDKMDRKRIGENIVEKVDLIRYPIDPDIVMKVSEQVARKYTLVPIEIIGNQIKIAMIDVDNIVAIKDVKVMTKMNVYPVEADGQEILKVINQVFSSSRARHIAKEVEKQIQIEYPVQSLELASPSKMLKQENYLQLTHSLIEEGVAMGASDIHIEPLEKKIKVRYRIDGRLQERRLLRKEMLSAVITCIKIMANLDIAEKRIPQDGRVTKALGNEEVDLRVSILPTLFGEKAMIRIIYRMGMNLTIDKLGFHPNDFNKFKRLMRYSYGLILITGPTGSGKSTTLAAMLRELNTPYRNIITVEDPVETVIEGVNQVVVNNKVGLTFANILRSILRQDPDILMIGEIRDQETAKIAIRAAITGHLVVSTLHTNDATSSIARLRDMEIESFMLGTAIKGVIAQRLVRKICEHCKESHEVTKQEQQLYGIKEGSKVYKGRGCSICHGTGYKGRKAIYEISEIDNYLREKISSGEWNSEQLRQEAIKRGMRTLWKNVYEDVLLGVTTMDEMLKIAYES